MAPADSFDPYRVLGVARDATPRQLALAYRRQAKRFHPDLHGPDAARQMRDLNRSWAILSNPDRRRAWDASHGSVPSASHWSGGVVAERRRQASAASAPSPAAWAAWEAGPMTGGGDAIRAGYAWPRPRPSSVPAPAGLRDSAWLAAGVAVVLVLAILVLGWVASSTRAADSPGEAFGRLQIRPANTVALDAAQIVGVYAVSDGGLGLVSAELRDAGWEGRVLDERPDPGAPSVRLVSDAGGSSWRSLVYGRAPAGATQVRLSVTSIGGEVANGTWVVGVRSPLREEQLIWWFEDADGAVLLSGSGELH